MGEVNDAKTNAERKTLVLWVLVLGLILFALSPALSRSHVEGFTYLTETMSLLAPDFASAEPLWGAALSYFYLSRPGIIWAMAPLSALAPGAGYNILMWIALPIFLCSLVVVTKLWSKSSWLASVATLLFLPIVLDTNFFFNDSLPAAALSFCGIALLLWTPRLFGIFCAGAFLSLAILFRLDQILLLPLMCVLAVIRGPILLGAVVRFTALVLGFAIVHFGMWVIEPDAANLLMRIKVVSTSELLWGRANPPALVQTVRDLSAFTVAVGIGLPAIIVGIVVVKHRARNAWTGLSGLFDRGFVLWVLLLTYPVAIYAVTLGKYYDPRGFLTMVPMLAPLTAVGLDCWVFSPLKKKVRNGISKHILLATVLSAPLFVPGVPLLQALLPVLNESENAPPSLTGRIWYGDSWRDWQGSFTDLEADQMRLLSVAIAAPSPTIVVTTNWTEDRALQNVIAVAGLRPTESQIAACTPASEVWAHRDGALIYHLRTHVPFNAGLYRNTAAVYLAHAKNCLGTVPARQRLSIEPYGVAVAPPPIGMSFAPSPDGIFRITDADLSALEAIAQTTLLNIRPYADMDEAESPAQIARLVDQRLRALLNEDY